MISKYIDFSFRLLICCNIFRLERQLNNALHQAGIYTVSANVLGTEEAVDSSGYVLLSQHTSFYF